MSAEWIAISNALAGATETAAVHAVAVHTEPRGSSSGIIWRPGLIVTAEHALRRGEEIQVTLPDGKVASAKLQGRDPST
ncbi:MAG: S1C family serine protease, partial [Candidatus Acidiferrum sp.]